MENDVFANVVASQQAQQAQAQQAQEAIAQTADASAQSTLQFNQAMIEAEAEKSQSDAEHSIAMSDLQDIKQKAQQASQ